MRAVCRSSSSLLWAPRSLPNFDTASVVVGREKWKTIVVVVLNERRVICCCRVFLIRGQCWWFPSINPIEELEYIKVAASRVFVSVHMRESMCVMYGMDVCECWSPSSRETAFPFYQSVDWPKVNLALYTLLLLETKLEPTKVWREAKSYLVLHVVFDQVIPEKPAADSIQPHKHSEPQREQTAQRRPDPSTRLTPKFPELLVSRPSPKVYRLINNLQFIEENPTNRTESWLLIIA